MCAHIVRDYATGVELRIFAGKELDEFLQKTNFVEIECQQVK